MRLHVELNPSWPIRRLSGGRLVIEIEAGLTLSYGPLGPVPDLPENWLAEAIAAEVPAGAAVRAAPVELYTRLGWPVDALEAEVIEGSEVIEVRLFAFFRFLEYCALVAVRGGPAAVAARRAEVLEVLVSARPDWRGPVVAEAQIWDGF